MPNASEFAGFCFIPVKQWAREEVNPDIKPDRLFKVMLPSPDKQFSLQPDGQIFFQPDASNPLPGIAIGRVEKGESLLRPKAVLADSEIFEGQDKELIGSKLQDWLNMSIHLALEPLFRLVAGEDQTEASKEIAQQLHDALGIIPRDQVQNTITKLDEEGRKSLRARKVRMGPAIIYMPDLNKPAAIKLRALLLTLWQGGELPAQTPPDGMVSMSVVDKNIDAGFYSKIGYPVFGPRAIRVDMLDRVICAIYDGADKGVFKAQHKMAEWMGVNIADLYAILEAMGHTKVNDPIEEKVKADEAATEQSAEQPVDVMAEEIAVAPTAEEQPVEEKPAEEVKTLPARPELATFRLKRNKAPEKERSKKPFKKDDKKFGEDKPKFDKKKFKGKPKDKEDRGDRDRERVYSAYAISKPEDNPFAALLQMKMSNDKK